MPERVIATVDAFDATGSIRHLKVIQGFFEVRTAAETYERLGEKRFETAYGEDVNPLGGNRFQIADTGEVLSADSPFIQANETSFELAH